MPLLRVEGGTLRDSTRIIDHLEAAHPEMPVHPGDPNERKHAAELEDFFDGLGPALRRFDRKIRPGGYLIGNDFSVADLSLAWARDREIETAGAKEPAVERFGTPAPAI